MKSSIHGHLRWNSADISSSATACGRVSARATAWRVSAEASGPSAVSTRSLGSIGAVMRPPRRAVCGNVVARKVGREVLAGGRMAGEVAQHGAALVEAAVRVTVARHGLGAGLMHARIEGELAAMLGILPRRNDAPSSDHLG